MCRRSTFLIILFILNVKAHAQVLFESGEVNLRGTLIFSNSKDARLVVNAGTRSMFSFDLSTSNYNKIIKPYKSGTLVDICLDIKSDNKKSNRQAQILKIRPLGPTEAVILYSGTIKACSRRQGCQHFEKVIEGSILAESIGMDQLDENYFNCKKN